MYDFEDFIDDLKDGIVTVTFDKVDGSKRVMKCTLNENIINENSEPVEKKTDRTRAPNENVQCVFDVENKGWRSFRIDSVTKVEVSNIKYYEKKNQ